ncbi:MAG: T9SS type A sorting domain-containing protein [Ignavibacteria bacterium]|nr:T9SS type A sorting domain-containing protein [Ignavibacteria bacterium]
MKTNLAYLLLLFFFLESLVIAQPLQTFCRNGINLPVIDNGTVRDSILVNVALNNVLDVNVRIDTLLHTWVSDLKIELRKNNTTVRLFNNTGGSGDNFVGTLLNDSALISIDSAAAPFTGSYRPNQPLNAFNSNSANGFWVLSITDNATGDTGLLKNWCLVIKFGFIDGINETVEIPNTYRLYQNYPNPFNPVTKIKYGLPKNGYVKLTVYDELGKEVSVLVDGYRQANMYEAVFDATNLPSGVYYYKLETNEFAETKKMVIIK